MVFKLVFQAKFVKDIIIFYNLEYSDVVLNLFGGIVAYADNKFDMVKNFLMNQEKDHMNIIFIIELYKRLHQ